MHAKYLIRCVINKFDTFMLNVINCNSFITNKHMQVSIEMTCFC